jgi:serine/threonine protein phosphatase PrpC
MEDSHIAVTNIGGEGVSLFGVFDGHGGNEVADFARDNFADELKKNASFKKGDYK